MYDLHILRIDGDGKPKCLLSLDAQSKAHITSVSQWSDSVLKSKSMVMLLPANWLYQSKTQIPSKNPDVLHKSIPFAVEEELSNEVEDNYYAFRLNQDGSQDVVAVEKSLLDEVGKAIKNHHLQVKGIYSELDWVPQFDEAISVWYEAEHALIRFADGQAMQAAHQQVAQLITMFRGKLTTIHTNHTDLEVSGLDVVVDIDEKLCRDYLLNHSAIDLYLSEIKQEQKQKQSENWRSALVLMLLVLLSWLGTQLYQMWHLSDEIEGLKTTQKEVFKQAFPNAAPAELVDPFAAIKSRMQLSANENQQGSSAFLDMVHHLGAVSARMKLVQIAGIRLVNEKIEIQISAPNISVINEFHQQLQMAANLYDVRIGVNELTEDNIYKSIITVVSR